MKYLFTQWQKLKKDLANKYIMLFLDYDGTLAPIAERPQDAVIPPATKQLLKQLTKSTDISIIIISGRRLEELKGLVGLEGVVYVGNHGLEIEGPKIKFASHGLGRYKTALEEIKQELDKKLAGIKGVFIEDKGLVLAVHYRLAAKKNLPLIKTIFNETVIFYRVKNKLKHSSGKMVLEIRPPISWDKGKAALWLLARQQFKLKQKKVLPVYIGDDKTDEDAFRVLRNMGLTVFVGKRGKSCARYYLKDTKDVMEFLRYVRINKGKRAV